MKHLIQPIIKHYYLTAFLILLITPFWGYNLKNIGFNNDTIGMIPGDHPVRVAEKTIKEDFGVAEMIMIGIETDNIFKAELLKKIKKVSKQLKKIKIESDPFVDKETGETRTKNKRGVANVISLSTMNNINGTDFGMEVSKLMKKVPKNNEEMAALKEKVFSWDFYVNNLVSEDATATLIGIEYKRTLSPDELLRLSESVRHTIEQVEFGKDVNIYIAGEPFVTAMVTTNMIKDLTFMLPVVFGVVILFLIIALRNISNVVLIILTIVISLIWTMGLMAMFDVKIDMITSTVPILLVAIGSAYSIHIVKHYSDERAKGKDAVTAVENSVTVVGISVLGAALTTMAGFMSLMTSSLVSIRMYGLFTGVGTLVAFVVSVILVPALLLVFNDIFGQKQKGGKRNGRSGIDLVPFLLSLSKRMAKDSKVVITFSLLIVIISFVFAMQVRPDLNLIGVFKKNTEIRKANKFLCEKFSGTTTMVISLEADEDDYFKNPDILRKLDELKTYMKKDPVVGLVLSLADPLKRMNYAMNGNDPAYDAIPETKEHVSQYLLLNSDPEALEGMVTSDYRKARVVILLTDGSTVMVDRMNNTLNDWLKINMPGLKVLSTGTSQLALTLNNLVVAGQIKSLIFSIVTVLVISSIILRSFIGGLLAITPLTISIILNFGILGLFRIPLDGGTALISAMGIGIAVDYSIHLLNGIRHGLITKGPDMAVDEGIQITGNAITFNALSVALGFLVLTSSSFTNITKLGSFVAFTMVTACVGTLLIIPVLVKTFNLDRFIAARRIVKIDTNNELLKN